MEVETSRINAYALQKNLEKKAGIKWYEIKSLVRADGGMLGWIQLDIRVGNESCGGYLNHLGEVIGKEIPVRVNYGDIILCSHEQLPAQIVKSFTNSNWSHVAMIIPWSNGRLSLLESTLDVGNTFKANIFSVN